jgi:hypothetical protein
VLNGLLRHPDPAIGDGERHRTVRMLLDEGDDIGALIALLDGLA